MSTETKFYPDVLWRGHINDIPEFVRECMVKAAETTGEWRWLGKTNDGWLISSERLDRNVCVGWAVPGERAERNLARAHGIYKFAKQEGFTSDSTGTEFMHEQGSGKVYSVRCMIERKRAAAGPGGRCSKCGFPHVAKPEDYMAGTIEPGNTMCFSCCHWARLVKFEAESFRVNGQHYMDGGEGTGAFKGFGGRTITFYCEDGRVVTSRNVWHQGIVPEYWRDELPDNATFTPQTPTNKGGACIA